MITLLSNLLFTSIPITAQDLQWFANDHFEISEASEEAFLVAYEKQPWEAFTLYLGEADFSKNTVLTFSVQSVFPIVLRVDLMDQAGNQAGGNTTAINLEGGSDFVEVTYDFAKLAKTIDLTTISHFHFYVNPGVKATGELWVKNIQLPEATVGQAENPIQVFPNPCTDFLKIKTTHQLFDELILFDAQGKEVTRTQIIATHYHEWSLTDLPKGFYQYQLSYQNKVIESDHLIVE